MNKVKFLFLILLCLSGCKATISDHDNYSGEKKILTKGDIIYVAIAENYSTSKKEYKNSGRKTSIGISKSLKKYSKKVFVGEKVETINEAFVSAKSVGAKYMIFPEITLIDDVFSMLCDKNNTDRVEFNMNIYSVETKEILKQSYLVAKGCPLIINGIPVGSTNPTAHVQNTVSRWCSGIFD